MKTLLTLLCSLPFFLLAQDAPAPVAPDSVTVDTTIYDIADEAPRFPSPCERLDTTAAAKSECSQIALLSYINGRALYPAEARENNVSGMVVIGFVVEANGYISKAQILRDPGAQLGLSALRAVAGMANEVRFRPAVRDGEFVRFKYILPIRFRLEERKPYVLSGRDTIYTELTKALTFTGNEGDLGGYFNSKINYPASGEDSCSTGQLDVQLIVHPNGQVDVQDIIDYNDLGSDFTFEAVNVATSSYGLWSPGEYEGRPVSSAYDVSFTFAPESAACKVVLDQYNDAVAMISEGQQLSQDSITLEAGLAKMDQAVDMFPRDGRFRIIRGQIRMDHNRLAGACEDLTLAKEIALIDWYDSVLPLLCRKMEEE
ncbi:energy transducer TonB [Neolewinella persica]|uniref:energy transducer TonB n=1 Tax=Neolewinella persica TaxID=70998 RepID=UPI0003796DC1|nr:energy transducer TonB [Neolewinella persica]